MLQLPKSTEFNKRIPKKKFYEHLDIPPKLRKEFQEKIQTIYWRNKISPDTVNLGKGERVDEVEVFEVKLREPELSEAVLKQIDKEVPYHILFLLEHQNKYQVWIGYKEASSGSTAFKVTEYYHTDWMDAPDLLIHMDGIDIDAVYESFVRQVAGGILQPQHAETLEESVSKTQERKRIQKRITKLEAAIRKEKQLNVQMQLNAELKKLKQELQTF